MHPLGGEDGENSEDAPVGEEKAPPFIADEFPQRDHRVSPPRPAPPPPPPPPSPATGHSTKPLTLASAARPSSSPRLAAFHAQSLTSGCIKRTMASSVAVLSSINKLSLFTAAVRKMNFGLKATSKTARRANGSRAGKTASASW